MKVVLVSLAVWKVTEFVRLWFEVPAWMVILFTVGVSAAGLWAAGQSPGWCLAVAAIAGGFHRLDGLLQAVRDWVRLQVLRIPRR